MQISVILFFTYVLPLWAVEPVIKPELVIYSYDSLVSKNGLGPEVVKRFESRCNCLVKLISVGDGAQLATRLELDSKRGKRVADIAWGVDSFAFERIKTQVDEEAVPDTLKEVIPELSLGSGFVPYDYGVFALMADTERLQALGLKIPSKLRDLLDPQYRKALVLEDPRTSLPGQGLMLWTWENKKGDSFSALWKGLKPQWITLSPDWSGAYKLFLKGEAPLVWSYTTSQAYHRHEGDLGRYQAVVFDEGNPIHIEGAVTLKPARVPESTKLARAFLTYLLDEEVQALVPEKNWMLPAVAGTPLPPSFQDLPKAKRLAKLPTALNEVKQAIDAWERALR